jgi:hypothetical protein
MIDITYILHHSDVNLNVLIIKVALLYFLSKSVGNFRIWLLHY